MKESISQFVNRKKEFSESREGQPLLVNKKLITIDGIDGSGKDTIAKMLVEKLQEKFGPDKVELIDITHFLDSEGKKTTLGILVQFLNKESLRIDQAYIAAVNRAYTDKVVPALAAGKIVVIPRSELNLVRYVMQLNDSEKINQEKSYLKNGTTTAGLFAGNRIFIDISAEDALKNINERGATKQDPKNVDEITKAITSQHDAEKYILNLVDPKQINTIKISNQRVTQEEKSKYLDDQCASIVDSLSFE